MKILVKVKSNARQEKIEKISKNQFQVWVKEPPQNQRANRAVIEVLSNYFGISKSQIKITSGLRSKQKCIDLLY
ncbi:MAG: DUF167 domain-containing protein [Candidatus Omnitrophica bacterium]|nr:DUF167 domain-containing protein [Candidatus Omnitrophota bacterium]